MFVVHAVVNDQVGFWAVVNQPLYQFPQIAGGQAFSLQVVADYIMVDPFQVLGQIGASVVDRCANQVFNVLSFGYHAYRIPDLCYKRKS